MRLGRYLVPILMASTVGATAQVVPQQSEPNENTTSTHRFFDRTNVTLQALNVASQTEALLAIQSGDDGGQMAPCGNSGCAGALQARGRTLDPLEKHFEAYGYGWGAAYRYGGGVGLNLAVAYIFHKTGHHKLERWVPVVAILHAQVSTGYASAGSQQGITGW
jgi:hypothetical protein